VKGCLALLLAAMLLSGTVSTVRAQPTLTWTAGPVGGGWYDISTGLAKLLDNEADLNVKVIPGGGAQNPVRVARGDANIGMGLPPLLSAAARGDDPYRGKTMENLRALAGNMSQTIFHFYVAADSPFATMTLDEIFRERKPIRLAIPRPGTSDVWVLEKIMEFYGLCASGNTRECYGSWEAAGATFSRSSYADQAEALKYRRVDGGLAVLASPAAAVAEASQSRALKLLACPQSLLEHLATFGLGQGAVLPGTYPKAVNAGEMVPSATMGTTIIVSAAMADKLAYTVTKTINDNVERVRKFHASLADYDPSKGWLHLGVPLHPGAERYYREKGWLR
jgi:TRAP transporter TAXI family solute receptor